MRKIPPDSIVAVGIISTRLGAVTRVDDLAPAAVLGALLTESLQDSGHARAILIGHGPEDRAAAFLDARVADERTDWGTSLHALHLCPPTGSVTKRTWPPTM